MKYDPHLRETLSNSVHAAHEGGNIDMRPAHINSIDGGLSFNDFTSFVKNVGDPISEAKAAKAPYDAMRPLDKVFSSPRHFAKAALHGYAGNFRAASAYEKATTIVPGMGQVLAPMVLPAAVAMDEVAEGIDMANDEI